MSTPILIPACNEAPFIERTLERLAGQTKDVEPIVIVNGSQDNTADLARAAGARVLESEHGKMRAIQEGMRNLGRAALDTVLILDADTRPFSKMWSSRLDYELGRQPASKPGMVWGPVAFMDDLNYIIGSAMSLYTTYVSWADRNDDDPRTIRGGNSGLKLAKADTLDELLALENYWPREDVAIFDTVMQNGGNSKVIFNHEAWASTSGDKYSPLKWVRERIMERKDPNWLADQEYDSRTPDGAKPYNSPFTRHPNKNTNLAK